MPGVVLRVEPNVPAMSWNKFLKNAPAFSIALDGYVLEGPKVDLKGPRANFNHHEMVDRLATRATCGQVLMAMRQGLFDLFSDHHGQPQAEVFVNDCDQDVCTATFLLSHSHLVTGTMNPILNRLVDMEDKLDTTAGAYPYPKDLPTLAELAWVFQPYSTFRLNGGLERRDGEIFHSVITDVHNRIMAYVTGAGKRVPIDMRYKIISKEKDWVMVEEIGGQARTGVFADRFRAYVSVIARSDGRYSYTVGRMSPFVPFEVALILKNLDVAEKNPHDHWGGGNTIGGSPRTVGSNLSPLEVIKLVNKTIQGLA